MLKEELDGSEETIPDTEKLLDEDLDKVAGGELAESIMDLKAAVRALGD